MHSHKDVSLMQVSSKCMCILQQQNNLLHALLLGILWNVTLVLKAKALEDVVGIGHLALALIALVLALEFAAWLRLPHGESH